MKSVLILFALLSAGTPAVLADTIQVRYQINFNDPSHVLPEGTTLSGTSLFDLGIVYQQNFQDDFLSPSIILSNLALHHVFTDTLRSAVPAVCDDPYGSCILWLGAAPETDGGGSDFTGAAAFATAGATTLPNGTVLPTALFPTFFFYNPPTEAPAFSLLFAGPFCYEFGGQAWSCASVVGAPVIAYLDSSSIVGPYTDPVQVGTWNLRASVLPVPEPETALLLACGLVGIGSVVRGPGWAGRSHG